MSPDRIKMPLAFTDQADMKSSFICLLFVIVFTGLKSWGAPDSFTYQGRILKVDGTPLEYNNVSFAFSITNQSGNCTFYQEQRNGVNMQGSGGVFDVPIGTGTRSFPTGPTASIQDAFKNSIDLPCAAGGTYKPAENETRILKVQFHDGSGWKAITPPSEIRSVPFASFSYSAARLGDSLPTDFVLKDNLASCAVGQYLTYNGTAFTCQNDSGGAGTISDINVSAPLVKGGTASIPTLSITVGTGAGSVAAGNDARFGDATKIQNVAVDATAPTANQVLKYNGTSSWVPSSLAIADVTGLSTQLTNKVDATMFPTSCTAGQSLVFVTPANKFDCYNIQITESQITGTIAGAKINGNIAGTAAGFTGALTGDVSGTQAATVVDKIKGVEVDATAPTTGQVLKFDGGKWAPASDSSNSGTITNVIAGTGLTGGGTSGAVTLNVDGSAVTNLNPANLSAAVPVNKGGTGQTTAAAGFNALSPLTTKGDIVARDGTNSTRLGVGSNGQILTADSGEATGLKWITPNAGTVTTVSAAAPLSVATASTTPAISIADGSINGQTLRWNAGAWSANKLLYTDLLNVNSLSPWPSSSCTAGQAVVWISGSDSFACSSITVSGSNFAAQSANTFLAGPTTGSAAPSFRTIASSDLPVTGAGGIYTNGGNSFGTASSLGTNDNQSLTFKTNNTAKVTILPDGSVGVGTTNPTTRLEVVSNSPTGIDVRTTGSTNNSISTGAIRILGTASGGTGAAGFGAVQQFLLTNSAGTETLAADAGAVWNSAAPGSENGAYIIRTGIGGTVTEKIRIDSNGSVGIGTTDPQSTLDVNGAIRLGAGTCNGASVGAIQYDSTTGTAQVCSGGGWRPLGGDALIPASSKLAFKTCPAGWTESAYTFGPTLTGSAAKLCESPATPSLIPAGSIMPMVTCPAGWTNLGYATNRGILGLGLQMLPYFACQSPAFSVGIPGGSQILSGTTCPTGWSGAVQTTTTSGGIKCLVCESPGGFSFQRLISGGVPVSATASGSITSVYGGDGGSTSGNAGHVNISGGASTNGNGGNIYLTATNGVGTDKNGGFVYIKSGSGIGTGTPGNVSISSTNATTGATGKVDILTGSNASNTNTSGAVEIKTGSNSAENTAPGTGTSGSILLETGSSNVATTSVGTISLKGGNHSSVNGGNGGSIDIIAGNGKGSAYSGGNINLTPGTADGGGASGKVLVTGNLEVTGTFTNPSDLRLKRNLASLPHPLQSILELRGVTYDWRREEFPERHFSKDRQMGVIAQEVEAQFPEAVVTSKEGFKSVNYSILVAPLIEAVKEFYAQFVRENESIRAENLRLRQENEEIKARLDRIEKLLSESK